MGEISLHVLDAEARARLDPAVYDFFAGGADDEITLRSNEAAFSRIGLVPRVLRGNLNKSLELEVLGCRASMPVFIAPTAFQRLAHPEGECATARAAARAGTIMMLSMASTVAVEEVAASVRDASAGGHLWFQLYIQPDLGFTEAIVRRAEAAGCRVLVVTVDSPVFGHRRRDLRNGFLDLPDGLCCENMRDGANGGAPRPISFARELSWRHIEWLQTTTALKIVLKGITHPEDARLAAAQGIHGMIVSNHGGRQLDGVLPAIDLLPPIADAIGGDIPVLMDGGVRRGTDVLKALALGAKAVAIGRPILWGLSLAGEEGVTQVLELFRSELDRALELSGCACLCDSTRDLVRCPQTGNTCCHC
jgi:4-hydroxymandelate oxidase